MPFQDTAPAVMRRFLITCERGDLNPHPDYPDNDLNVARLPFRHSRLEKFYHKSCDDTNIKC